jgi:hypothetical protein
VSKHKQTAIVAVEMLGTTIEYEVMLTFLAKAEEGDGNQGR